MVTCSNNIFAAQTITSIVEFFSFSCGHCLNAEPVLMEVLQKTNASYIPIIVPSDGDSVGTAMIYYASVKKGFGWQFRSAYWRALQNGAKPNSPDTAIAVLNQITNNPGEILAYAKSQDVQTKIALDVQMIKKYKVNSTPTFIINDQYQLDGEDALNSFLK